VTLDRNTPAVRRGSPGNLPEPAVMARLVTVGLGGVHEGLPVGADLPRWRRSGCGGPGPSSRALTTSRPRWMTARPGQFPGLLLGVRDPGLGGSHRGVGVGVGPPDRVVRLGAGGRSRARPHAVRRMIRRAQQGQHGPGALGAAGHVVFFQDRVLAVVRMAWKWQLNPSSPVASPVRRSASTRPDSSPGHGAFPHVNNPVSWTIALHQLRNPGRPVSWKSPGHAELISV